MTLQEEREMYGRLIEQFDLPITADDVCDALRYVRYLVNKCGVPMKKITCFDLRFIKSPKRKMVMWFVRRAMRPLYEEDED